MSKERYLIVKGCAGLGNRLLTLTSAIDYALKTERKLIVDWSDGQFAPPGCNAFPHLFQLENIAYSAELPQINDQATCYPSVWTENLTRKLYDLYAAAPSAQLAKIPARILPKGKLRGLVRRWKFSPDHRTYLPPSDLDALAGLWRPNDMLFGSDIPLKREEDIVIFSDYVPPVDAAQFLNHVRVSDALHTKINAFSELHKLSTSGIGIHIRHTDKKGAADLGNVHRYIEAHAPPDCKILLCTDNVEIQNEFLAKYQNLVTTEKHLPDLEPNQGMHQWSQQTGRADLALRIAEDAVIDMWLLSRCSVLIFQGNSTFSTIARFLHGNPLQEFDWTA